MSERSIRYIVNGIKAILFALPLMALFVADSLFFPFITGKNFLFRIVVEVLFFFWVFVAVFDKQYRPRKSAILLALTALLLVLTLATIFGENPYRSFWSNYERMEGLVGHIHLFGYFLILTSVMRFKRDWKVLFGSMVGVSAIVTGYGFLQFFGKLAIHQSDVRLDATLGNSGYLAIYLIFHLFLISLFFFWFKNKWVRVGLVVLFVLETLIIFYTATRGAILGLVGALFLFALLMAVFSKNKKIRTGFLSFLIFWILIAGLFLIFKDSQFVKSNNVLSRLASISLTETTVESRFTIWGMSLKGFQEHPVLGWGPENYNLVFNKYYEPKLYKQEPWFDRSHNIIFDWLINAGILGLLAYLSIFISVLYIVWNLFRKNKFSLFEASAAVAVFAAYFFHNIFVFDNLTSYFMFFSVLGYVHYSWVSEKDIEKQKEEVTFVKEISPLEYVFVTGAFVLIVFSLYFVNIKPILACKGLLNTLRGVRISQSVEPVLGGFDKIFSYNSFGTGEAREQLSNYVNQVVASPNFSQEDKIKALTKGIDGMEKQVISSSGDIRYLLMLSSLYGSGGRIDDALVVINKAIDLSPKKQQLYFMKADFYLKQGKLTEAIDVLKEVYEIDKTFGEVAKNLAIVYLANKEIDKAEQLLEEHFGDIVILDKRLVNAYVGIGRFDRVRDIWERFVLSDPNNIDYHVKLAATHVQLNENKKALEILQETLNLSMDSNTREQIKFYISEVEKVLGN